MFKRSGQRAKGACRLRWLSNEWHGDLEQAELDPHFGIFRVPFHLLKKRPGKWKLWKTMLNSARCRCGFFGVMFVAIPMFAWALKTGDQPETRSRNLTPRASAMTLPVVRVKAAAQAITPASRPSTERHEAPSSPPATAVPAAQRIPSPGLLSDASAPVQVARPEPPEWSAPLSADTQELVATIKAIFRREGIPGQLVWLVEVESRFDAEARSRAGARGLFQFTREGATAAGLALWPRDERLDPHVSARAAACHLKSLKDRLGSWELALAAYNSGEYRVKRELEAHGATAFGSIARHLPRETENYVRRVLNLIASREGIDLGRS